MTIEQAAGVLCWRRGGDGVEVLLVHRPRYDDWSWPKGKVRDGEQLPVAAVREAAEETGVAVVLGRPLGMTRYRLPDGRRKHVTYWAARPAGVAAKGNPGDPPAGIDGKDVDEARTEPRAAVGPEVDEVTWLPIQEARARLTRSSDAEPLHLLEEYASAGVLATAPVLIVRHGTSRSRDSWGGADPDRPLVAAGRRQAQRLVGLLTCWRPERLVSSPWRRCLETIAPYASATGLPVRTKGSLSEDGARRSPSRARRLVRRLLGRARPALLCTHRPVLAAVFDVVRSACPPDLAAAVPTKDPFLAPGEVLVAHVAPGGARAAVVAVERHQPRS